MTDAGFDDGLGTTNIDLATGIRFGVINSAELGQNWYDESETDYGLPVCGWCGTDNPIEQANGEYLCSHCGKFSGPDDVWREEPLAFTYEGDGYVMQQGGDDVDIFILASPFYTRCAFCSPCAPGAGYLMSPRVDGIRAYCPGHDWYEGGVAPYPVFSVADDTLVIQTSTMRSEGD